MSAPPSPIRPAALLPLVEALEARAAGGPPLPLPPAPADPLLVRLWAAAAALTAADPDRSRPAGVWPAARGAPAGAALAPAAPASAAAPPPPALGAWPAPAAARAAAAPPLPPAARPAAAPAALVGDRAVRVLAVDDNEVNRIVLAGLLGELRCVVQLASDGEDALRCYGEDPPDLVIMDLHMPRLDGLTAAARIRALERARGWARRPILALTADRSPGVPEACALAGMDDLQLKPVELDGLRARLEALLGGRPAAAAPAAPPPPVLDPRQVEMMREVMGPDAYALLVSTFLSHTEGELAQLRAAVGAGDAPAVQRAAHSLKSSTAQMGASALSALARQIEGRARAGNAAGLGEALAEAGVAFAALRAALERP
jgi:CheY-like chemotaxis protein/HPt (histidine-containing phosphotransfer) domain-containing protein